jgi:hypothetical protein
MTAMTARLTSHPIRQMNQFMRHRHLHTLRQQVWLDKD